MGVMIDQVEGRVEPRERTPDAPAPGREDEQEGTAPHTDRMSHILDQRERRRVRLVAD